MQRLFVSALITVCLTVTAATATTIVTFDPTSPITLAGALPSSALNLSGQDPDIIYGNLGPDPNAVNVFALTIQQPLSFSAFTFPVLHSVQDTELFLFNTSGIAVYENDDVSASNTLSCLPSLGSSNPCPSLRGGLGPVSAGLYYLAITRSSQLPLDSNNNYLFTLPVNPADLGGPLLTAGVANPVAGWDGGAYTDPNFDNSFYAIALTGTTPEPGTFILLSGVAGLGILLRKRVRPNSI